MLVFMLCEAPQQTPKQTLAQKMPAWLSIARLRSINSKQKRFRLGRYCVYTVCMHSTAAVGNSIH